MQELSRVVATGRSGFPGAASFRWICPMRSTSLSRMSVGARTRVPLTNVPFAEPRSVTSAPSPRRRTQTWLRETNSSVLNGGPNRTSRPSTTPRNDMGI